MIRLRNTSVVMVTTITGPVGSPPHNVLKYVPRKAEIPPKHPETRVIDSKDFTHGRDAMAGATNIPLIKMTPTVCSPKRITKIREKVR